MNWTILEADVWFVIVYLMIFFKKYAKVKTYLWLKTNNSSKDITTLSAYKLC